MLATTHDAPDLIKHSGLVSLLDDDIHSSAASTRALRSRGALARGAALAARAQLAVRSFVAPPARVMQIGAKIAL